MTYFIISREAVVLMVISFLMATGMIGPGMIMAFPGVALPALRGNTSDVVLNSEAEAWFASLPLISQIVGSLLTLLTMKFGRRFAIGSGSFMGGLGWIVMVTSWSTTQIFVGRILTGLSIGMCSLPCTTYLGEIARPRWRALLTSFGSVFIYIGMVLVYILGFFIRNDWKLLSGICIIPAAISILSAIFIIPESPRYLLLKGRTEDAKKALMRIRGVRQETVEFQEEFKEIARYIELSGRVECSDLDDFENNKSNDVVALAWTKIKYILNVARLPEVWKPLIIINTYFFFMYFTGIYVLPIYAVDIINSTVSATEPYLMTVILGVIQVVGGMLHILISTRIGRRPLSIASATCMFLSLGVLILHLHLFKDSLVPGLPMACIFIFVASGSCGIAIIPWALIGEIFPTKYISILGSMTTCTAALMSFIIIQVYPAIVKNEQYAAIYMFCGLSLITVVFILVGLPETLGRKKLEIEEGFRGKTTVI